MRLASLMVMTIVFSSTLVDAESPAPAVAIAATEGTTTSPTSPRTTDAEDSGDVTLPDAHRLKTIAGDLERVGLVDEAQRLRALAGDISRSAARQLEIKRAELSRLQQEVQALDGLAAESLHYEIRFTIVEADAKVIAELFADTPTGAADLASSAETLTQANASLPGLSKAYPTEEIDRRVEQFTADKRLSVLTAPVVVTTHARPASVFTGSEFPIQVPGPNGVAWKFIPTGLSIDIVPRCLPDDKTHLDLSINLRERDDRNSVIQHGTRVPGVTERQLRTTADLSQRMSLLCRGFQLTPDSVDEEAASPIRQTAVLIAVEPR